MDNQGNTALYAKGQGKFPKKKPKDDPPADKKCDNCDRTGHTKADCYRKGGSKEGQAPAWGKKKKGKTPTLAHIVSTSGNDNYTFHCSSNYSDMVQVEWQDPTRIKGIMDSGTDVHFCTTCENFVNFVTTPPWLIKAADGHTFYATGKGDVWINITNEDKTTWILLKDAHYSPDLGFMLISVPKLDCAGY